MPLGIEDAFRATKQEFQNADIKTAELDASLLLEEACGATTLSRLTNPTQTMSADQAQLLADFVARRLAREPVHRIIGMREFYGLDLKLNAATLVPRPDTEVLVDMVLPFVHQTIAETGTCSVLDLGTGTGAIALAILAEAEDATATATDISAKALEIAAQNARAHGLKGRLKLIKSDWFESISETYDLIVSNPPYIATKVIQELDEDVRVHDPILALDGGADGLDAYRILADEASDRLNENGRIAVEIGFDQRLAVQQVFETEGFVTIARQKDLNGLDRSLFFK